MVKKKVHTPFILLLLICILTLASLSYAEIPSECIMANTTAMYCQYPNYNLTVNPEPVRYFFGSEYQEFEVCNTHASGKNACVAYVFDEMLTRNKVELYKTEEVSTWCPGYANHSTTMSDISGFDVLDNAPPFCDIGVLNDWNNKYLNVSFANSTTLYACVNATQNLGGGSYGAYWWVWQEQANQCLQNVTDYFNVKPSFTRSNITGTYMGKAYNNASAYHTCKYIESNECINYRIQYATNQESPKWDLWFYGPTEYCYQTSSCNYYNNTDPTFDTTNFSAYTEWNYTNATSIIAINVNESQFDFSNGIQGFEFVYVNATDSERIPWYIPTGAYNASWFRANLNLTKWITPDTGTGGWFAEGRKDMTIRLYYLNSSEYTNTSTFYASGIPAFSDDFNIDTLNTTKWKSIYAAGASSVLDGVYRADAHLDGSVTNHSFVAPVEMCALWFIDPGTTTFHTGPSIADVPLGGAASQSEFGFGDDGDSNDWGLRGYNGSFISNTVGRSAQTSFEWDCIVTNFTNVSSVTGNVYSTSINDTLDIVWDEPQVPAWPTFGVILGTQSGSTNMSVDEVITRYRPYPDPVLENWVNVPPSLVFVTTITPVQDTIFFSSDVPFNVTANGTLASYTCNWTRNGVTNTTNFTIVDNTFHYEPWTLPVNAYQLSTTCSNETTTDTSNVNFSINTTFTIALIAPSNGAVLFNRSIDFEYEVNYSDGGGSNVSVELFLDSINIYNDTITVNTTLTHNFNTTYGDHEWYVYVYLSINESGNATSTTNSFEVQFNTTPVLISPLNDTTQQNKTVILNYSVNVSAEENTTVQLFFDGVPIFNDTITANSTFSKEYNTRFGVHSWYVFSYLIENQTFNSTSETWILAVDFEVEALNPINNINLSAIDVSFVYNVSTLHSLNCSIVIYGDYIDNRTVTSSGTIYATLQLNEGTYNYIISCTDSIDITYQKNTTNRTFYVSFTALTSTLNLTDFPQNVYAFPQTLFFDIGGELYVYYFSNNASIDYVNLLRINFSTNSVEQMFYQPLNRTRDFFVAMREPLQTVLMAFNNDSTILHYFNITENELTISNLSTTYNDTMSNAVSDPYTYAYTKQFETLDFIDESYYLFVLPLTNGSVLIKKFIGNQSLEQVASANDSLRVVYQTITNNSNLTTWAYALPKTCADGNHSITLYNFNGSDSSEIATPDGNCYNQTEIENSTVIFESYENKTYALISNITNFTTLYLIEENKLLNFTYTVTNPSHFFFVDKYTFVFFVEEPADTIAYSCYFEDVANCTRLSSSDYGIVVPYDRGQLVSAKREELVDVVVKGAIASGSNVTQLSYNFNRYDVKILCYDEVDEYRKVFRVRILTNTTSTVLKNNSWGYVLPSAVFGIGDRFAYTTCTNGTQRLYFIGLSGNFTQYAFSLDTTAGQFYTFTVVNEYGLPLPNVLITAYKFSDIFNAQMVIEQGITDFGGHVTLFMKTFDPYLITLSATSYLPATFPFTPSTITSVEIQLSPNTTSQLIMPDYQIVFQDILWSLTFNASPASEASFFTSPFLGLFQLISNTSALEYFGMNVYYNGTLIFTQNITAQAIGGFLQYNATLLGQYRFEVWFKREGFDEYRPYVRTINLGNATGLASVSTILQEDQPISGWGYYFIVVVLAMLVGGFAARYTLEGAGLVFLAALWVGTLLFPGAIVACMFGSTCLTAFSASALTTVAVGAGFFIKQYV